MDFEQFQTSMLSDWTATLNGDAQRAAHKKAYILYWPLVWPLFFKQSNESTPRHMSLSDNAEDVNDVNVLAIFNEWLVSTHAHVFIVMSQKSMSGGMKTAAGLRGRDNGPRPRPQRSAGRVSGAAVEGAADAYDTPRRTAASTWHSMPPRTASGAAVPTRRRRRQVTQARRRAAHRAKNMGPT